MKPATLETSSNVVHVSFFRIFTDASRSIKRHKAVLKNETLFTVAENRIASKTFVSLYNFLHHDEIPFSSHRLHGMKYLQPALKVFRFHMIF